ncbi:MAG: TlyA family RNA methyltransferase [Candidatus Margulisiibacteriota bacterium]
MPKIRLDVALLNNGLAPTREKAQALIMAGTILVDGQKKTKPGDLVPETAVLIQLGKPLPYVSRGGEKLAGAWEAFGFPIADKVALDVGISTGGFTDFLLQNGAKTVFGVDVGYGQLDLKIRNNPNVLLLEKTNARHLSAKDLETLATKHHHPATLYQDIRLVVMDVSFISVTKILPGLSKFLSPETDYIVLIKPQFEAEKSAVGKGGIIRDETEQIRIADAVVATLAQSGFTELHRCPSPILGTKGNREFVSWLKQTPAN